MEIFQVNERNSVVFVLFSCIISHICNAFPREVSFQNVEQFQTGGWRRYGEKAGIGFDYPSTLMKHFSPLDISSSNHIWTGNPEASDFFATLDLSLLSGSCQMTEANVTLKFYAGALVRTRISPCLRGSNKTNQWCNYNYPSDEMIWRTEEVELDLSWGKTIYLFGERMYATIATSPGFFLLDEISISYDGNGCT